MTRQIQISKGYVALIDDEDYERVSALCWNANESKYTTYAQHTFRDPDGRRRTVTLHRFILNTPAGLRSDHINGNGLDCRRCNLRPATAAGNARNRRKCSNKFPYKGIDQFRVNGRFRAVIQVNYKKLSSPFFDTIEEAARAYDDLARLHFGEFARLNFPNTTEGAA